MQTILMLRDTDDGDVKRIINIDLLAAASVSPENPEWTVASCGVFHITIHMPFPKFVQQVEDLIAENYRVAHETNIQWHKKRMSDQEAMMKEIMAAVTH